MASRRHRAFGRTETGMALPSERSKWALETWHIVTFLICVCAAVGLVLGGMLGIFSN